MQSWGPVGPLWLQEAKELGWAQALCVCVAWLYSSLSAIGATWRCSDLPEEAWPCPPLCLPELRAPAVLAEGGTIQSWVGP